MTASAGWAYPPIVLRSGYTYRNRLTVARQEDAGYAVDGHSAVFRLREPGADEDLLIASLALAESPLLAIVDGSPDTLVLTFDLALTPLEMATALTVGQTYVYAVDLTDSRAETTPVIAGTADYMRGI